jgi:hypothetical protein
MDEATLSNKKNDSKDYKKTKQWTLEQYLTNSRVDCQMTQFDICGCMYKFGKCHFLKFYRCFVVFPVFKKSTGKFCIS